MHCVGDLLGLYKCEPTIQVDAVKHCHSLYVSWACSQEFAYVEQVAQGGCSYKVSSAYKNSVTKL